MKEDSSENNYSYVSYYWHIVAQNINEFIVPECQDACISLWSRNIGTFMCSNREELEDVTYILLNKLSEQNKDIFEDLIKKGVPGYSYDEWRQRYKVAVNGRNKEQISEALLNMTNVFEMQDVLEGYYDSVEEAIADHNNFYTLNKKSGEMKYDFSRLKQEIAKGKKFSIDQFLICEDGRVWKDIFYADRHKKYLEYIKEISLLPESEVGNKKKELLSLYMKELERDLAEGGKYYTGYLPFGRKDKTIDKSSTTAEEMEELASLDMSDDNSYDFVIDFKYDGKTISIIGDDFIMVTSEEGELYQEDFAKEIIDKCLEDESIEMDPFTRFRILQILKNNQELENENQPVDTRYNYQYVPWHIVEANPDEYIIPECQGACKALWDKNIGTFMCSNRDELDDIKYIDINSLSDKNTKIIEKLIEDGVPGYSYDSYRNAYRIYANGEGEEVAKKLEDLAKVFEMQDVLEGFYVNSEEALIERFGISKVVKNPGYVAGPPISSAFNTEFLKACYRYEKNYSRVQKNPYIYIFDPSKMEKSEEEYFEEADLIKGEDGRVWLSDFYIKKHEQYVKYMKSKGIEIKADDFRKVAETGTNFFQVRDIRKIMNSINQKDREEKSPENPDEQ